MQKLKKLLQPVETGLLALQELLPIEQHAFTELKEGFNYWTAPGHSLDIGGIGDC